MNSNKEIISITIVSRRIAEIFLFVIFFVLPPTDNILNVKCVWFGFKLFDFLSNWGVPRDAQASVSFSDGDNKRSIGEKNR